MFFCPVQIAVKGSMTSVLQQPIEDFLDDRCIARLGLRDFPGIWINSIVEG
jgi:hypothetical protein